MRSPLRGLQVRREPDTPRGGGGTRKREALSPVEVRERQTELCELHVSPPAPEPHAGGTRAEGTAPGGQPPPPPGCSLPPQPPRAPRLPAPLKHPANAEPGPERPRREPQRRGRPALTRTPFTTVMFSFSSASKVTRRVLLPPPPIARQAAARDGPKETRRPRCQRAPQQRRSSLARRSPRPAPRAQNPASYWLRGRRRGNRALPAAARQGTRKGSGNFWG